ncbi:hypothetical protein ABZ484_02255 [Streptomyces sp. NPDC006393]|uniref:hypothetical protein n=1 Tax=Streptomyces sp. NPDC006393 TaxID=3156763 RepID=UPI0033C755F9
MHRTTTTATLLVTVAVAALTGCVTVQRPPVSGPAAAPSPPLAPRPDGSAAPRPVQAPAQEALERVAPPASPHPTTRPGTPAHLPAPPHTHAAPEPRGRQPQPPNPRSPAHHHLHERHPGPRHQRPPRAPHAEAPSGTHAAPGAPADPGVCALGRQYGGWRPDSPEARICGRTYGR